MASKLWCEARSVALAVAMAAAGPALSRAQAGDDELPGVGASGEPRDLVAPRVPGTRTDHAATITVVSKQQIQQARATLSVGEALARVTGVFVQNELNFAQDARIAIRGFGARAAFGIRGLTLVVDDVPETLADGQTQIDSLDLGSAESIEVLRGPASALYGNAAGGVVVVLTETGPTDPFAESRTDVGQYGQLKQQLKGGGQFGSANVLVNLSSWSLEGYRDHGAASGTTLNSKLGLDTGDDSSLVVVLSSVYAPRADDAGGLTAEQIEQDPRQAAALNLQFDTTESVAHGRLGLVYRRALAPSHSIKATAFTSARDFDSAVPFRVIGVDRVAGGGSAQYHYRGPGARPIRSLVVGVDVQRQSDQRQNRDNLDGVAGELTLDQNERVSALAPYAHADVRVLPDVAITGGVRADVIEFDVADRFLRDGDASGARTFKQSSGRVGVVFNPRVELGLYAHFGQAFETPTTTELADPSGGFDPELAPQRSWTAELGARGAIADWLEYSAVAFRIDSDDELVAFEDAMGRRRFRNAGESRRTGAEADVAVALANGVHGTVGYSLLHSRFRRFVKADVDLSGNRLPGLPEHRAFAELGIERAFARRSSWFAIADATMVGRVFADDENTATSAAHLVANARGGITVRRGRWQASPYVSIRNVGQARYNANVRINAFGGRFFEPAPPAYAFAGVSVRYTWQRTR